MTDTAREKLLLQMYDQMLNDINRHIMVVWQSVGVVVGAIALFSLAEKGVLPIDIAASLILLLCAWLIAHMLDASYWYNRNLVIIANIERQFLTQADLREVHYYFGAHRPRNRMIMHLRIQVALGVGVALLIIIYHFINRVAPGLSLPWSQFDVLLSTPYAVSAVSVLLIAWLWKRKYNNYQEFLQNSPGIEVDSTSIKYGTGHGYSKSDHPPPAPGASNAPSSDGAS